MLDPPSRKIALILFCAISCCAFWTRAARSSFVIGLTSAVIDFNAAIAGCTPELAGVAVCACAVSEVGVHATAQRPMPAAAPLFTKERREILIRAFYVSASV